MNETTDQVSRFEDEGHPRTSPRARRAVLFVCATSDDGALRTETAAHFESLALAGEWLARESKLKRELL